MLFGVAFFLYSLDPVNSGAAFAGHIANHYGLDVKLVTCTVFAIAALFVCAAAFVRTWASAYLSKDIVYASGVKSATLVAGGPYRYVRNPLYFGNLLLGFGVGALASRSGFVFLVAAMFVFNYRLIFREEAELAAARGDAYASYLRAVPRLFPSPWPRVPKSGQSANWAGGFRAESWVWAFALGVVAFALTLKLAVLWGVTIVALLASWFLARASAK